MKRSFLFGIVGACAAGAWAADWTNNGGNAQRNGRTSELGPDAATQIWSAGGTSIISWQPVTAGDRVFVVRQSTFPPESTGSPVVALDLNTGAELWRVNIPAETGDWTTWIAGVSNDQVYVSRSGNGASVAAKLYALDVVDGSTNWTSADDVDCGPYDGVIFAPDGDPIFGNASNVRRIDAVDGSTVWQTARICNVTGSCGPALFGDAVYLAEPVVGGNGITKFDLNTGARLYTSETMIGFTLQNTPMIGPDGTIYLARTQNNPLTDFFYALEDTGSAIEIKWSYTCGWTTFSEFAVGDGVVFAMGTDYQIKQLDAATGAELATTAGLTTDDYAPRMAIDSIGRLFYSNGIFGTSRIYCLNPDLSVAYTVNATSVNIGAPVIGRKGTLVIAGTGNVRAFRTERPCAGDLDGDEDVDLSDLGILLADWGCSGACAGDVDGDGDVDLSDLGELLAAYAQPC